MDELKYANSSRVQNMIENMLLTGYPNQAIAYYNLNVSQAFKHSESKSRGHVTITYQMLASTFRAFPQKVCFDQIRKY